MNSMTAQDLAKTILEVFDRLSDDINLKPSVRYGERALALMFRIHSKPITEVLEGIISYRNDSYPEDDLYFFICGSFCKTFRQADVIYDNTKGLTDMVLWNLINNSELLDKAIRISVDYHNKVYAGEWNKYLLQDMIDEI